MPRSSPEQKMEFDCKECKLDILDIFFEWSSLMIIISCYCPNCREPRNFSLSLVKFFRIRKKSRTDGGANGGADD